MKLLVSFFTEERRRDNLKEEGCPFKMCGIVGVLNEFKEAAPDLYIGLYALQHRGKESARIVTSNGKKFYSKGGMGEIPAVFKAKSFKKFSGKTGIAHNRYSTTSSSSSENIQPIQEFWQGEEFWLAHNGNLVNTEEIKKECFDRGKKPVTSSDTGAIATLISLSSAPSFEEAIKETAEKLIGAFSIVILKRDKIIALRDELGIRPLHLGRRGNDWIVTSETCVFGHLGAVPLREIEPGEILIIERPSGERKYYHPPANLRKTCKECIFEYIYFKRPDSVDEERRMSEVRKNMGRLLAREHPVVGADLVIPIPDSGIYGGLGFIEESGIKNGGEALFRPHIFSRTFIEPVQEFRDRGIELKYVILREKVEGKRVVLVDDSVVRGNTIKRLIHRLREAGAKEVHVRVHSPSYHYPCYLGIDTYRVKNELLAVRHNGDIEKMREEIDADSLGYLSIESTIKAITETPGRPLSEENFCTACFTGKYPVKLPQ